MDIATWITHFKTKYPEFAEIKDQQGVDVTNTVLTDLLDLAMNLLPQGAIEYFTETRLWVVVDNMVCHLLTYFDMINNYGQIKSVLRATGSMSANGLSISYETVASLRGDMFSSLNAFLATSAYGQVVSVFLNQMAGSCGGYVV